MSFDQQLDLLLKYSGLFNNVTGTVINLILAPIVLFRSSSAVGSYKYLLLSITVVELVYCISIELTDGHFHTNSIGWVYIANLDVLPIQMGYISLILSAVMAALISTILALSFVYRYAVLCSSNLLLWYIRPNRVLLITISVAFIGISCSAQIVYFYRPSVDFANLFMTSCVKPDINLTGHAYFGIIVYDNDNNLTNEAILSLSSFAFLFSACSSVYAFTTVKILKGLKNTVAVNFSATTLKAQRQLFELLMFQTLSPALFLHVPVIISYIFGFLRIESGIALNICSYLVTVVAVIDPLLILYFIKEYRDAFIGFVTFPIKLFFPSLKEKAIPESITMASTVNSIM